MPPPPLLLIILFASPPVSSYTLLKVQHGSKIVILFVIAAQLASVQPQSISISRAFVKGR